MAPRSKTGYGDTSFLLPFGSVAGTRKLLSQLFAAPVPAAAAVKRELDGLAAQRTYPEKQAAAQKFQGMGESMLEVFAVPDSHQGHVEEARKKVAAAGNKVYNPRSRDDLGESESIVLCLNDDLPLVCQDGPATVVAKASGIVVKSTVQMIASLSDHGYSAAELHRMAAEMHVLVGIGSGGVPSKTYFERPT